MSDASHLDAAYFVSDQTFNCPFCKRRNVMYSVADYMEFDWTDSKPCLCFTIQCSSCGKTSMHLTYNTELVQWSKQRFEPHRIITLQDGIDDEVFYSVPTAFFSLDTRIPRKIRDLMTEADGCAKMNFLTGASSCMRKAIYQLLSEQGIEEGRYDERIKALKRKHSDIEPILFDTLGHIKDMTSNQVHEASWEHWDANMTRLVFQTLKVVLDEIYVVPDERNRRARKVHDLYTRVFGAGGQ